MIPETPNPYQAGGNLTAARQSGDPARIAAAEATVAEAKIASAIRRNLAAAPPLSPDQLRRLRGLLRGVTK
ncbi:hypothetical protein [Microbacterium sp. BH-3-3-3]|uniref:hypothetical protein n=1 Tax=Microbacterium sp. BH-3-3-3 TaxID=1906742 RepID=UPI0009F3CF71|nr:hypothetical protein [Microbacterium sp. BH-3-3-3]